MKLWLVLYLGSQIVDARGPLSITFNECNARAAQMIVSTTTVRLTPHGAEILVPRCVLSPWRPGPQQVTQR
jgi:hypothetical protein